MTCDGGVSGVAAAAIGLLYAPIASTRCTTCAAVAGGVWRIRGDAMLGVRAGVPI